MDACATALMAFPPAGTDPLDNETFDKAVKAHVAKVSKILKEHKDLVHTNLQYLLDVLSPTKHSISFLALLDLAIAYSRTESPLIPQDDLLTKAAAFLVGFDARQIRYFGQAFTLLVERAADGKLFPPPIAVALVSIALLRLDPTGSMLTSSHLLIVSHAYETGETEHVLELISKNIVYYPGMAAVPEPKYLCDMSLPPTNYITKNFTSTLKSSQVMEYDLVCGLIWCSKRNWAKAFDAFKRVVTYPSRDQGASKIMVEAYKKWVLVGLLLNGQAPTEPSYTASSARKVHSILGRPYLALADHFTRPSAQEFMNEVARSGDIWSEDKNVGLVQEVVAYYQRWQILNLQDVYSKISISDIREQTKSGQTGANLSTDREVENLLRDMIATGMLKGTIETPTDGSPPYLVFQSLADKLSEVEFATELAETTKRIKDLGIIFRTTNERLAMNKEYIKHLVKEQHRLETGKKNGGDHYESVPLGFDSQIEDEDLMTGVVPS